MKREFFAIGLLFLTFGSGCQAARKTRDLVATATSFVAQGLLNGRFDGDATLIEQQKKRKAIDFGNSTGEQTVTTILRCMKRKRTTISSLACRERASILRGSSAESVLGNGQFASMCCLVLTWF